MPKLSDCKQRKANNSVPDFTATQYTDQGADIALFEEALERAETQYQREIEDQGVREWIHPDGSFRAYPPSKNPVSVVRITRKLHESLSVMKENRRKYASLVKWCIMNGGDEEFSRTGVSFRHGINCSYQQHKEYLSAIGQKPETDANGSWFGLNPLPGNSEPSVDTCI